MLLTFNILLRGLKNIFLSNWYKLCGKLAFPIAIIPRVCYAPKIDIHSLLENQTIYIIRRSDSPYLDTFNVIGEQVTMREAALRSNQIPSLSLNLLGGFFKAEHSCFRVINKGRTRWPGNEPVFISEYINDYAILKDYCIIYFNANNLHNQSVTYPQSIKTTGLNQEVEKFFKHIPKPIIKDKEYQFVGKTRVVHDPIMLNYWHIEFDLLDFKNDPNEPLKYNGSKYVEKYCQKVIKDILCANSFDKINSILEIPKEFYNK